MQQTIMWVRFCFWLLVVILTLGKQMMLAMDLMAIGMCLEAAYCLYRNYHRG